MLEKSFYGKWRLGHFIETILEIIINFIFTTAKIFIVTIVIIMNETFDKFIL